MRSVFYIAVTLHMLWSHTAFADLDVEPPTPAKKAWPNTIVIEWQGLNIEPEVRQGAGVALKRSQSQIAAAFLGNAPIVNLDTLIPNTSSNTSTLRRSLNPHLAGDRASGSPILVQPMWTSFQGAQIFMLVVSDSRSNVVLRTVHQVVPSSTWKASVKSKSIDGIIRDMTTKLTNAILSNSKPLEPRSPDLAIGLTSTTVSNRVNEIERNALSLIFAANSLDSYTIINPLSHETLASIHQAWSAQGLLARSNRNLSIGWIYPENTSLQTLPVTLKLAMKPTDGVFGQPLTWQLNDSVTLNINGNNQLSITSNSESYKNLNDHLAVERKSLERSENPAASSIRGAWVYLDKGRAWGLKMNDRLVIANGSSSIKGHIVGYYGAEMHLKSPRGFPIAEGAIMFVRKGQRDVKVGQEFAYDQMVVPVAWPPVSSVER